MVPVTAVTDLGWFRLVRIGSERTAADGFTGFSAFLEGF